MGSNTTGALGIGKPETPYLFYPNLVTSLTNQKAVKISSGGGHTLALMGIVFIVIFLIIFDFF